MRSLYMTTTKPVNNKISKYGYLRVKAVSPLMEIGNVSYNVTEMISEIKKAVTEQVSVVVFPELGITGYTCDDLFHQSYLLDNARKGLSRLLVETKYMDMFIAVGLPYQMPDGRLYNTAVMLHKGKILGMTLKKYLPNYNEFYDMRYFASGIDRSYQVEFDGQKFEAGDQIYQVNNYRGKNLCTIGIEICEDGWSVISPANSMALCGANIILNLSASNALIAKAQFRKSLFESQSGRLNCVYVYVSSGPNESVKDTVFSGTSLVYENGNLLAEGESLVLDRSVGCSADVDMDKIAKERRQNTTFGTGRPQEIYKIIDVTHEPETVSLKRTYSKNPFVPSGSVEIVDERCEEIFNILSTGLARQIKGTGAKFLVMGLSGGMDSTTGALIAVKALKKLGKPSTCLHTISMPGFGTSDRTKQQSRDLAKALNTTFFEISIEEEVTQHLKDIKQPENLFDATYENSQARARSKLLWNWANQSHEGQYVGYPADKNSKNSFGLSLNNSSLSEVSEGFFTNFADGLSSWNNLGTLVKSLEKVLLRYEIKKNPELKDILTRILETPISPELLPNTDKKEIIQKSEDIVGSYDLIDFVLYYHIRWGYTKNKIKMLLNHVYKDDKQYSSQYLEKVVDSHFKRFYANQFKRSSNVPPSIKLGIDLNPRSSWRMPDLSKYEDSDDNDT